MFGRKMRRITWLTARVDQAVAGRDSALRERDAYRQAATAEQDRGDSLREMLREARTDAVLAQRAEGRALRRARAAEAAGEAALRRVERLQRAVARYRAEYAERSRQEQGALQ